VQCPKRPCTPIPDAMEPKNLRFGGGAARTILHPSVAVGMLIAIALIFALPRKKATTPFLLAFFMIPVGQQLVLGGVHLLMHQTLILTVLARMAAFGGSASQGKFPGGFNPADQVAVLWSLSALIMFFIQFMDPQARIKGLGDLVVGLGGYMASRSSREICRHSLIVLDERTNRPYNRTPISPALSAPIPSPIPPATLTPVASPSVTRRLQFVASESENRKWCHRTRCHGKSERGLGFIHQS
jgi:hypothetical protein